MSRVYKFRAWYKYSKKMLPVGDIEWYQDDIIVRDDVTILGKHPDDAILMQYTGLKDSKDVEIYEGDIIKDHTPGLMGTTWQILWDDSMASWGRQNMGVVPVRNYYFSTSDLWWEVIGNIHSNPELLDANNRADTKQ